MSILDTTAIAQTVQQNAQSAPIALPDGCFVGRCEPIVDPVDWANGLVVSLQVALFVGDVQIDVQSGTYSSARTTWDGSNTMLAPSLGTTSAIPTAGATAVVSLSASFSSNIGARLCAAPDAGSLPAPLPAPQGGT